MADDQIKLAGIWIALMLSYLLGDVLRIFSGDATSGKMGDLTQFTQGMWLGIAVLMVLPILMIVLSLFLPYPIARWANIVVAVGFFLFNLVGLPTYPGAYDRFLLAVGLGFNVLTVWVAWKWVQT
jgi:hypothetical protein